jgi:peptide chain release factor subunit 1
MITAETVNGIVRFQANGLPVVSLYCRVDPSASQREVRARVDSLLGQIRPLAKDRDLDHRYRLSVRTDIERVKDALDSERWPPGTIAIFSCSGRGLYEEIPLPHRVDEQAASASRSGPMGADREGDRLRGLQQPALLPGQPTR